MHFAIKLSDGGNGGLIFRYIDAHNFYGLECNY
jgi:hypothetical protein